MASLGLDNLPAEPQEESTFSFKIHGKLYHCIGNLPAAVNGKPVCIQLYFIDTDNEVRNRLSFRGADEFNEKEHPV